VPPRFADLVAGSRASADTFGPFGEREVNSGRRPRGQIGLTKCTFFDTLPRVPENRKRLPARFYESANGRPPVRDWLMELEDGDRRTIGKDIAKAEFGWPIGMPSCRSMGAGLFEIRSNLSGGKIGRVLFGIVDGGIVLLHGFIKKTQTTPKADLDLARKRLKEVE
jgi:phage-related protein